MSPMRRIAPFMLAASLALVPTLALAHTELTASDPADGSTVSDAPDEAVLTFAGELDASASFTVLAPDGEEVGSGSLDLEVVDRNVLRGPLEVMATGEYTIAWSVVGEDGHDVEGEVTFTYDPDGDVTTPDTAIPAGTPGAPALMGVLLVVLAATVSLRRAIAGRG